MTAGSRLGLRLLFGLVLLSLPVMVVVREQKGEFYPALYQPAFDSLSMRGDVFEQRQPVIMVLDAAGRRHRVDLVQLIDAPDVERSFVLGLSRSAIGSPPRMGTPAALDYLRERLPQSASTPPRRCRSPGTTWRSHPPTSRLPGEPRPP
ncbi:hypothetical protein [Aeromicrobium sp. UC242_57]|uniref:hypothetical protein n=1 Tax=Aeromicrobium sp. UC242_57 TaxID=3374624 RepID=UPI0037B61318